MVVTPFVGVLIEIEILDIMPNRYSSHSLRGSVD